MRKKCSSALLLLLSLIFVFTAACSPAGISGQELQGAEEGGQRMEYTAGNGWEEDLSEQELAGKTERKAAKGRYREEKVDLPFSVNYMFDVQCREDGKVRILFESEPGSFYYWESCDGGSTWEQKELGKKWLPEEYRVVGASFGEEDIVVSVGKMSEDPLDENHAVGEYAYFLIEHIQENAQAHALQLPLPEPREENLQSGYGLEQILLSAEGKIYGVFTSEEGEDRNYEVYCFAPGQGEVLWQQKTNVAEIALYEDKIYLNEYGGAVQVLDAGSGDKLEELSIPLEANFLNSMDVNTQEEKIFYCNKTGIYGTDYHSTLTELLVDGNLSSFSDISYDIKHLCSVNENVFLLFVQNVSGAGMELLRYEFDAEMPAQPEHKLVVYSLKENYVLEKMISDFRSSHPEVQIVHEVGMGDTAVKEEADAISILNTEIMAGSGPDVLLLNGLPWESYAQKGILKDLHSDLASYINGEEGFANIFEAYKTDGAQYAAPISFKFPVVVGVQETVSHVQSSKDLLTAAEGTEDLPAFFRQDKKLLRYMFSIYWQNIQEDGGTISKEGLRELLETVGKINDRLKETENEMSLFFQEDEADKSYDVFANDNFLDASNITYGNVAMDLGYLSSIHDFWAIVHQGFSYQAAAEGVFSALIAGINSESQQEELAGEFLDFMLSEEEQKIFIDGMYAVIMGFPVNKAAFAQTPSELALAGEIPRQDEKGSEDSDEDYEWMKPERFAQLLDDVANLTTPAMENTIVIEAIQKGADGYLWGGKSLDAAVEEISKALELYFLERE